MKILITGATGFVGRAIAEKLKSKHHVAGLARSTSSAKKLEERGIVPVIGNLLDVQTAQFFGYDVVIHCAAFVEEWGTEKDFFETNVTGTERVILAAKAGGVKRFIFIGTEAAFFDGQDLLNIDESIQYPKHLPYHYSRSKAEAERKVLAATTSEFKTLSLRPRFVWGPGDQSVLPALIAMIKRNRFAWIDHGKYQISSTYIDNLVHAVEQALPYGEGGEAFFIADEGTVQLREFLTAALQTQGIKAPSKSIPKPLARGIARAVELIWNTLNIKSNPPLTRFSTDMMSAYCTVNTEKAKKILKYSPPVSREQGLERLAQSKI